jgi:hypothetical protein
MRSIRLILAGLAVITLAGCETAAPYQPQQSPGDVGYSDAQLAANRFRVTFTGNSATGREVVEDYLLRRAAEVTLKAGYHWFEFDTRDTKSNTTYYDEFGGWRGRGRYWHSWAFGPPMPYETRAVTRYQAYAEIVLLTDDQAKSEPRALGAQDVLNHLGPPPPSAPPKP